MRNLNSLCFLVLSFIIIGCDNETEEPATITVTPPATYSFERNGASTVSYSGQSARLEMAAELGTGLNTPTKTATELNAMFNDGTGFGNSALDESGKKLGNKTENGRLMFVYQAFEAFKLWHGIEPQINSEVLKILNND